MTPAYEKNGAKKILRVFFLPHCLSDSCENMASIQGLSSVASVILAGPEQPFFLRVEEESSTGSRKCSWKSSGRDPADDGPLSSNGARLMVET